MYLKIELRDEGHPAFVAMKIVGTTRSDIGYAVITMESAAVEFRGFESMDDYPEGAIGLLTYDDENIPDGFVYGIDPMDSLAGEVRAIMEQFFEAPPQDLSPLLTVPPQDLLPPMMGFDDDDAE
jgi:hypothetical protein